MRVEKFAIKRKLNEETQIATLTAPGKKPVYFPENPLEFVPLWLIPRSYDGSYNGKGIKWMWPLTKVEVFRWDENPTRPNGPHYHIHGMGHFYPGQVVPEPWASFFFPHLQ